MVITDTFISVEVWKNKTNSETNLEKHNSATNLISKRLSPVPGYLEAAQGCFSDHSTPEKQIYTRLISDWLI